MRRIAGVLGLALALGAAGCAFGASDQPSKEDFAKVQFGMTKAEVRDVLGSPNQIMLFKPNGSDAIWSWGSYSEGKWRCVQFQHHRVYSKDWTCTK
jgi:hypothetical protein